MYRHYTDVQIRKTRLRIVKMKLRISMIYVLYVLVVGSHIGSAFSSVIKPWLV